MRHVDLGESFPTSIYLQNSASIQPRTSPSKFGRKFMKFMKFNSLFIRLLSKDGPTPACHMSWQASSREAERLRPAVPSEDRDARLSRFMDGAASSMSERLPALSQNNG